MAVFVTVVRKLCRLKLTPDNLLGTDRKSVV